MQEKYLPLGTVVLLKEGKKRLMIIGFAITASSNGNSYDYLGCLYPEGVVSNDKNLVFNHDQIAKIEKFSRAAMRFWPLFLFLFLKKRL